MNGEMPNAKKPNLEIVPPDIRFTTSLRDVEVLVCSTYGKETNVPSINIARMISVVNALFFIIYKSPLDYFIIIRITL